jgi:hypothetical protein
MAPPPTTTTQLNASANIGGRRINRKKVNKSQRLTEKRARKEAAAEAAKEAQIDLAKSLQQFHFDMAKGKYDAPLLSVLSNGDASEEPSEELKAALEAQKAEFLSGKVPFKQQFKVKQYCESQVQNAKAEEAEPTSGKNNAAEDEEPEMEGMD